MNSLKIHLTGGDNGMELDEISTKEIARLIDWLVAHGHTSDDAADCIRYIAGQSASLKS